MYLGFRKKQSSVLATTEKQQYVRDQLLFKRLKDAAGFSQVLPLFLEQCVTHSKSVLRFLCLLRGPSK